MANKFVIILNNATKEQQDIITQRLKQTTFPYWHWIENVWLVATENNVSARSFSEWIEKIPGINPVNHLIFRIDGPCPYYGRNDKEAWNWMSQFWGLPSN